MVELLYYDLFGVVGLITSMFLGEKAGAHLGHGNQ